MKNMKLKWMTIGAVVAVILAAGWMTTHYPPQTLADEATGHAGDRPLWTCPMHPQVIQDHPGTCPICRMKLVPVQAAQPAQKPQPAEKSVQLWTCSMHPQVIQDHPGTCPICHMKLVPVNTPARTTKAAPDEPAHAHDELVIDPAVVQNMGIQLETVRHGALKKTIRAAGFLTIAQPLRHDINLRLSGWIEQLSADTVGMRITKGQKLFDLYSPQLTVAVQELIAAKAAASMPAHLQQHEAAGSMAETLYQSTRQKLRQWGLSDAQVDELATMKQAPHAIPFYSPIDGILVEKSVVSGSAVQTGQQVMRLVDYRTLWLDTQIFPQDMQWIHLNQPAQATFESQPGQPRDGQVIFIDPTLNPQDQTTTVRIAIDNKDMTLRPGMFATVQLIATPREHTLLAPRSAIIDSGTRQVAFVSRGQGHFQPRDVTTGLTGSDDTIQILSGLEEGDQVVVSGQFMLDADSRMKEAVREFLQNSPHSTATAAHDHPATQPMSGAAHHD